MNSRIAALLVVALLVGCGGPTHTVGTNSLAAKDLAILSIAQLPEEAHIQLYSIQFDEKGDSFSIGKNRDFYLLPGDHTASFVLIAKIPGAGGWFVPTSALTFPGPQAIPLGAVSAGKAYELAPNIESFKDNVTGSGTFSLLREKPK